MAALGIVLTAFFLGCGGTTEQTVKVQATPSQAQEKPGAKKTLPEKHPLAYYESTLRPSDFDREVDDVQRIHIESKPTEQLVIPRDSMALQEQTIMGFRIQILSTSSVDEAGISKLAAQQLFFADSIYVVYDPPVYKVRVGDYNSRLDANAKLPEVQEKGYQDAWVVPDKVVQRKWISVARPEGSVPEEE